MADDSPETIWTANEQQLIIRSRVDRMTPTYHIDIDYTLPQSSSEDGSQWRKIEFSAPFTQWFTADGQIVIKLFHSWLASNTLKINVSKSENFAGEINKNDNGLDKITTEGEAPSGSGYTSGSTARARRRG